MDLILEPERRTLYDKCKYKVKYWEHQFKKKNGRLPSKLDIREANNEIRHAYKTYFNLKTEALEASFQNIDGFDFDDDQENSSISLNTPNISTTTTDSSFVDPSNDSIKNSNTTDNYSEEMQVDTEHQISDSINSVKTWGSHLNNITETEPAKSNSFGANSSFTKKLFKNSNLSKRNLRKSLSFHQRKSETNLNSSINSSFSLSQPSTSTNISLSNDSQGLCQNLTGFDGDLSQNRGLDDSQSVSTSFLNSESVRVTKPVEPVRMNSLNVVQAVLDEKFSSVRNVDVGWMKRVAASAGTKMSNKSLSEGNFTLSHQLSIQMQGQDDDSDDIIGDSDEEEDTKLHFSKRRKLNDTCFIPRQVQDVAIIDPVNLHDEVNQINSQNEVNSQKVVINTHPQENDQQKQNNLNVNTSQSILPEKMSNTSEITTKNPKKLVAKVSKRSKTKLLPEEQEENVSMRKSTRTRKSLRVNLQDEEEEEDPFANYEENDPDFAPNSEENKNEDAEEPKLKKSALKAKTSKTKSQPKKTPSEDAQEDEDQQQSYELEFSVKPRRVTVPRDPNFKNVIKKSKSLKKKLQQDDKDAEPIVKTAEQMKREEFEKKVRSGNLNDNYVTINIEKKKYTRGKKSINFSKYKRQQWKQKKKASALCGPDMDMRGCDGGQLTCFNCGQVGHFAQKCPQQHGDRLLPMGAAEEEYCPFPTLEEASEMAMGSQLAVRKIRVQTDRKDGENGNVVDVQEKLSVENEEDGSTDSSEDESEEMFSDGDDDLLAETLKLEEFVKKANEEQFVDDSRLIKPYYDTKEDGTLIETPQEVFDVLSMFGHTSFRSGQEKAIMRILSGQSTLVTLSTGSGKSLCYQLPAYLLTKREPCIALVISPLVSLMEDQVTGIPKFLKAECLHTNKTKLQRERILNAIATGDLHILLVSPEAVVAGEKQTGFGSLLRKLPPIAFACIDEAHCVSQWSHNFRPSYLMICSILKERLGVRTILGLTATATRATSDSIISHLSISDGRNGIISDTPLPNNLRLTVSKDGNRDTALLNLILSDRFASLKSIIVYCTRRQECERIAALLRTSLKNEKTESEEDTEPKKRKRKKMNVQAEPYHAGLAASKRKSIQNSFMRGDLRIVVATVAFGMGINKSDIRAVIHYNLPKNFESYVQEVGRAGRDGLPAHCHLFLDAQDRDENELQRHIFSDSLDRHVIRKLNAKIFVPCTCKGICPKHEVAFSVEQTVRALDIPEENISTLLCYLELHDKKYIEVLSPAYITCKITAYGSANHIRKAAKDCPPLAMALAMFGNKDNEKENIFEFPIVDVAASMGWDSGICKYKLKNLEWTTENNQPKRSLLTVQFLDLGFRLLAPGNLSGEQLDEVLDSLHERVQNQEKCALLQLRSLHETVTLCAETTYRQCIGDTASEKEIILKKRVREYFDSAQPLSLYELKPKGCDEGLIANDCRAMISMYRDNSFTGRALARIFYGIQSPNYPAVIWGRCKFWRAHINSDFHKIVQIATKEIIKHR